MSSDQEAFELARRKAIRDKLGITQKTEVEYLQSINETLGSIRRIALFFMWLAIAGLVLGLVAFLGSH